WRRCPNNCDNPEDPFISPPDDNTRPWRNTLPPLYRKKPSFIHSPAFRPIKTALSCDRVRLWTEQEPLGSMMTKPEGCGPAAPGRRPPSPGIAWTGRLLIRIYR